MSGLPGRVYRGTYTAALMVFRRLPGPVRRVLVRAGTPGFTVGAVCVFDHDGDVLVLRQPHRPGWSLPGGLLEKGETPAQAVVREVREETGIDVQVGVPLTMQAVPHVRRVDVVYRVTVSQRPAVQPAGEAQAADWLTPAQILADADGPTREIFGLLVEASKHGATDGRVVRGA